jgi:hypothetical protein
MPPKGIGLPNHEYAYWSVYTAGISPLTVKFYWN